MPEPKPVTDFVFTDHALLEMKRRGISEEMVSVALAKPEQMELVRAGRMVYQAKIDLEVPPKTYILRIFVDIDRNSPNVVTVYKTSKLEKYWR
ncbi:MAG: DUF4258 domain-containing protein [Anaerolineales bacterium]